MPQIWVNTRLANFSYCSTLDACLSFSRGHFARAVPAPVPAPTFGIVMGGDQGPASALFAQYLITTMSMYNEECPKDTSGYSVVMVVWVQVGARAPES